MAQAFASEIDDDACSVDCLHPDAIRLIDNHLRHLVLGAATHVSEMA